MDAIVGQQTEYLELRLAECRARPELHAHQIAAYENHLALIGEAADAEAYARSADMFEIAQAEALDRYYNEVCIYAALGADRRVSAALLWYEATAAAVGHGDMIAKLTAAARASQSLKQADGHATSLIPRFLVALAEWATEAVPEKKEEHLADVKAYWRRLRDNDRELSWQRVCEYPPYRAQSPFDDLRMQRMGMWLEEAIGAQPEIEDPLPQPTSSREILAKARALKEDVLEHAGARAARRARASESAGAAAPSTAIPSAAQAAAGYHLSCEEMTRSKTLGPATRSVFERLFAIEQSSANALDFLRQMAREHILARVAAAPRIDAAVRARTHGEGLAQPHLEQHYDELIATLQRCQSTTEVEFEVCRLEALHTIETAWNEVFLAYATRAIGAVFAYEAGRTEALRESVRRSYRMVCDFFGRDWDAMLDTHWIRDLFAKLLFVRGQEIAPPSAPGPGAMRGELGLGLAMLSRNAAVWSLVDAGSKASFSTPEEAERYVAHARRPRFATPEAMRAHVTGLFQEALGDERHQVRVGPPERSELRLWGQRVHLDDLLETFRDPPRPEVRLG